MVSLADCYHVSEEMMPLYVAMFLAYASVKWWKLFTPDQYSGISTFVSNFSVPLLFFNVISTNNPYNMSLKLIFSDFLQKLFALVVVIVFSKLTYRPVLDTVITGFSLLMLPNTIIVGVPLLKAMYRDEAAIVALAQLVSLQSLVWYNLVLFLLELRAARATFVVVVPLSEIKVQGEVIVKEQPKEIDENAKEATRRVNTNKVLLTVWRKLIRNPNTHATLRGLICVESNPKRPEYTLEARDARPKPVTELKPKNEAQEL